jgi:KipI family sensor histidine kinase inhibitor
MSGARARAGIAGAQARALVFDYRVLTAGDTAIVVEFGDSIDRDLNAIVLALSRQLDQGRIPGLVETIPTFRSLMVFYQPELLSRAALEGHVAAIVHALTTAPGAGRLWRLPVCYDAGLAPDLIDVASRTGLTPAQIVERHSGVVYHVYMLGFLPGLAYTGDVPRELVLPRLVSPRPRIPAGMLGIAMSMSLIMPRETPSGLNLIGRSPVAMWRQSKPSGGGHTLLTPGDQVIYQPISAREYEALAGKAAAGELELVPERASQQIGSAA